MYKWFCPEGGTILDPFAGGSVRGIVANYLGFKYTGIELRQEQVDSNREQALDILPIKINHNGMREIVNVLLKR
jgi:DNA modification methylase